MPHSLKTRAEKVYRFPVDRGHKDFVDDNYDAFLQLARSIPPSRESKYDQLTDHEAIAQLQDLYFLLQAQAMWINEERSPDGSIHLVLQIRYEP